MRADDRQPDAEASFMLCYVITTGECNLKCDYCGGSFPEHLVPPKVKYRVEDLKDFLSGVDKLVIAFYGGEPLLNSTWIMKVMDEVDARHFVIQTNGLLIDRLPKDYWLNMDAVLLSIDGVEEVTDKHRGRGVYRNVVEAAKKLRRMGYEEEIIARMTLTPLSDVYRDVLHLLSLNVFDNVHWQLNAVWNPDVLSFKLWAQDRYVPRLRALVSSWVRKIEEGCLLGVAPLKAISYAMIKKMSLGKPPCGAGWKALAVNTNGTILACPIAVDVEWAKLGDVRKHSYMELLGKVAIGEPCVSCKYCDLCGGRCLYAYYEKLWGDEGFLLLCHLTQLLIDELHKLKPKVEKAMRDCKIDDFSLRYPAFPNSIEIIP